MHIDLKSHDLRPGTFPLLTAMLIYVVFDNNICDFGPYLHLFVLFVLFCLSGCTNPFCVSLSPLSHFVPTRMMVTGYKRPLEEKDLWSLNQENCSKRVVSQLVAHWNRESQNIKRSGLLVFCKTEIRKHFTNAETAVKHRAVILMVCGWYAASESDDGAMNSEENTICNALPASNSLAMFVIKVRDVMWRNMHCEIVTHKMQKHTYFKLQRPMYHLTTFKLPLYSAVEN